MDFSQLQPYLWKIQESQTDRVTQDVCVEKGRYAIGKITLLF